VIDTTGVPVDEVIERVLSLVDVRRPTSDNRNPNSDTR